MLNFTLHERAEVAELADALRSGRSVPCGHMGSTPIFGILGSPQLKLGAFFVEGGSELKFAVLRNVILW